MAYDEGLAERIRPLLADRPVEEKSMMGGLTFMVDDKMCLGVLKDDLMVRIDPDRYDELIERAGARPMDFMKSRPPSRGFLFVGPEGTSGDGSLEGWVGLALAYNKLAKPSKKRR